MIGGIDHRIKSETLIAAVADLAAESKELERWSRAFQR
jgi:hypothetical protein